MLRRETSRTLTCFSQPRRVFCGLVRIILSTPVDARCTAFSIAGSSRNRHRFPDRCFADLVVRRFLDYP